MYTSILLRISLTAAVLALAMTAVAGGLLGREGTATLMAAPDHQHRDQRQR